MRNVALARREAEQVEEVEVVARSTWPRPRAASAVAVIDDLKEPEAKSGTPNADRTGFFVVLLAEAR